MKTKQKAIQILRNNRLLILVMQTRVGKTLTALSICMEEKVNKVLFISSTKYVNDSNDLEIDYNKICPEFRMDAISHDSIHKVTELYDIVVVDEVHVAAGKGALEKPSKRAKKLRDFFRQHTGKIIIMSGTPTPETVAQWYPILWITNCSPWKEWERNDYTSSGDLKKYPPGFRNWSEKYINVYYQKVTKEYSVRQYDRPKKNKDGEYLIVKDIEDLILSVTRVEADFVMPEPEQRYLPVAISGISKQYIDDMLNDQIVNIGVDFVLGDTAAKRKSKILQLCSGGVIVERKKMRETSTGSITADNIYTIVDYSKLYAIHDDAIDRGYKRFVIFIKFNHEKQMVKDFFSNSLFTLTESARKFMDRDVDIMLMNIDGASEGLRFDMADAIYVITPTFRYVKYAQMISRMLSRNATDKKEVVWVISSTEYEKIILQTVRKKEDFTAAYYRRWEGR